MLIPTHPISVGGDNGVPWIPWRLRWRIVMPRGTQVSGSSSPSLCGGDLSLLSDIISRFWLSLLCFKFDGVTSERRCSSLLSEYGYCL
ncbi:hypothetical protein GUJ93_ZPchr0012g20643 [Zizania palustris]|uniref:Uncharacterized protein n=1 Tax=Zizania palustris TaxID=103762 RepID=A0A8J6BRQ4_ZIZPA|nr:hypothetical protein GUJ93_ZPchr0012g20643 [Zizania palustris]